jgi:hypothetical protein
MRWVGHEARMREMRNSYKVFVEKPKGRRQLGRHVVDSRIISRQILEKSSGRECTGLIWLRVRVGGGLL